MKEDLKKNLINDIYKDKKGETPDMSRLDYKKKSNLTIFLIGIIAVLAVLAGFSWLGFFIFNRSLKFSEQKVAIEIKGPEEVISGEETVYFINYINNGNVELQDIEASFHYPEGFIFKEAEPHPSKELTSYGDPEDKIGNMWHLENLKGGKRGKITIRGVFIGEIGSVARLNASLTFRPLNFSSEFEETSFFDSKIISSPFSFMVNGPSEVRVGEEVELEIKYQNNIEEALQGAKIKIILPSDFTIAETIPELSLDKAGAIYELPLLKPQEEKSIILKGKFSHGEEGKREFKVQIAFAGKEGQFFLQEEKIHSCHLIGGELIASLTINGLKDVGYANFGEKLHYSIVYKNKGEKPFHSLQIKAIFKEFGGNILDRSSFESDDKGYFKDDEIIWDENNASQLKMLSPGEEGVINFQINVKSPTFQAAMEGAKDLKIENLAEVKIGEGKNVFSLQSNPVVIQINTDLDLKIEGRYFDENSFSLGEGPLPFEVGKATTLRIFLYLSNSLHDISQVKVSVLLAPKVSWTGKSEVASGEISFDSVANKMVWEIPQILTNFEKPLEANFEISVKPQEKDVGKVLVLVPEVLLEGKDEKTGGKILREIEKTITSDLEDDPIGKGKGRVVRSTF